jgi:KaiC/GvpD/RAD55 family RecA-like ATPase
MERVQTGISGLDEMLNGGIPQGRHVALYGGPGSGKCTFSTTKIKVRNKHTGQIMEVDMETFFTMTRPTH